MKVVSTEALTKLIQLVKSTFIKVDDTVQTQEVTLASVATSGDYDDLTNKPDLTTKADIDLSNITSEAKNIANWSTNVSNCITEIPQDIKLELLNGTIILKAGSKVYVPNGFESDGTTPKFNTVTITNDISMTQSGVATWLLYYTPNGDLDVRTIPSSNSGSTAPSLSATYQAWYDTTNNLLKFSSDSGSTWASGYSLPIAIVISESNSSYTSIDQVFNGFGYIGSTVFALPGVKGLIPDGRNDDGTLNSTEYTVASVITATYKSTENGVEIAVVNDGSFTKGTFLKLGSDGYLYNNAGVKKSAFVFASCKLTSGVISNFNSKTAFHTLDYNDSSTISGWSMPSSMYINLTLGVSGSSYIAPANGYFALAATSNSGSNNYAHVQLQYTNIVTRSACTAPSARVAVYIPVKKGDTVQVTYQNVTDTNFIFKYAEGSKSEAS